MPKMVYPNLSVTSDAMKWRFCYGHEKISYTSSARLYYLVIGSFYIVISLLAINFNMMFLTTIRRNRRLHRLSNFLLVFLCVVDLISACVIMPSYAVILTARYQNITYCSLRTCTSIAGYCLASMSFTSILSITIEQYTAIVYPFFHQSHVTLKSISQIIAVSWFIASVWCVGAWVIEGLWIIYQAFLGCFIFLTYVFIIYCYSRLFILVKHTEKRMHSIRKQFERKNELNRRNKAVKTSSLIILAFSISYVPIAFITIWRYFYGVTVFERTFIYEGVHLLSVCNTFINPIVYYWRLSDVRREILKLFWVKTRKNSAKYSQEEAITCVK